MCSRSFLEANTFLVSAIFVFGMFTLATNLKSLLEMLLRASVSVLEAKLVVCVEIFPFGVFCRICFAFSESLCWFSNNFPIFWFVSNHCDLLHLEEFSCTGDFAFKSTTRVEEAISCTFCCRKRGRKKKRTYLKKNGNKKRRKVCTRRCLLSSLVYACNCAKEESSPFGWC